MNWRILMLFDGPVRRDGGLLMAILWNFDNQIRKAEISGCLRNQCLPEVDR